MATNTGRTTGESTACSDAPDKLGAWLRLLAADAATALSWRWLARLLPVVLVALANAWTRVAHGPTAILLPARTGGVDHGMRAVLSHRNPMLFGGRWHAGAACTDTPGTYAHRRGVVIRQAFVEIRGRSGATHLASYGWIATRRVRHRGSVTA